MGAGGEKKEAFYRSFLENFGGGYLISPIFYENYLWKWKSDGDGDFLEEERSYEYSDGEGKLKLLQVKEGGFLL